MGLERFRERFPALQQKIGGRPIVYFDNAAMTLKPQEVLDAMREYYEEYTSVTGRSAHKWAAKTTEKVDLARKEISKFVNAEFLEDCLNQSSISPTGWEVRIAVICKPVVNLGTYHWAHRLIQLILGAYS